VERVRERGRGDLGQDFPRELPSLVSIFMGQRAQEGGRERGGRLGCPLVGLAKKEKEKRREEESLMNLAEFHLNFERF
jgi:hypothetical protein